MKMKLEHGTVENGRFKAGANDLTDFPPVAREMIFRACDLEARFDLMDRFEREYDAGNREGACMLFHAELYLRNRHAYQLDPPPFKTAIPADFLYSAVTEAIQ